MERTAVDRLSLFLAQGLGLGRFPVAPGTVGSVGALGLVWLLKTLVSSHATYAVIALAVCVVGVPLCTRAAKALGRKDPPSVVIDEIAAMLLIFIGVPWTWPVAVAGFVVFRILDISKPWPVRVLERLPGGWGVMADDLFVGAVTAGILAAFRTFSG